MRSARARAYEERRLVISGQDSVLSLRGERDVKFPMTRVGVIGCGYWGPQLIRNFASMADAQLVGVADKVQDRLNYVRSQYSAVRTYTDHTALLTSDVEAVVVATPVDSHFTIARDALLAGKHVLVEKPLCSSVAESLELVRLANDGQLILMAGHTFLYNLAVAELRRILHDPEFGKVFYVDTARLNLGRFSPHSNVIWDLAPHDVSILSYILGRNPVAVSAFGSTHVQTNIHDVAYVRIEFEGGINAQVHVSWLDPAKVRRITVVGDKQMVVYNDVSLGEKIRIYNKGVTTSPTDTFGEFQLSYRYGPITIPYIGTAEPLRAECQHFLTCVRSGQPALTDGMAGLAVVAVLEAANHSLKNDGRRQPVRLPESWSRNLTAEDILPSLVDADVGQAMVGSG
jgi:predicted dehydrogenase